MHALSDLVVDKDSPVPLYYQIAESIRAMIESGRLKAGDPLPPEVALSEELGVSRLTVRRALAELVNDGVLIRRRAKGTFVAPPRESLPLITPPIGFTEGQARRGRVLHSTILSQEVVPAVGRVARQLQLAPGSRVIRIRRLRVVEGVPTALELCCFPYDRFPELATMQLTDRSIYQILQQQYDALPQEALDSYAVHTPTSEEASILGIAPSTPVIRFERTAIDSRGQVVEFTRSVFSAERFRFSIRRRRSDSDSGPTMNATADGGQG